MTETKNITWAWKDDDDVYINKAEDFEEIIETIITYYDDEIEDISMVRIDGKIKIKYIQINHCQDEQDELMEFEIDATCDAVSIFLEELAQEHNRQDRFDITDNGDTLIL